MHFPSPLIVVALAAASLVQAQAPPPGGAIVEWTHPDCMRGSKSDFKGNGDILFQGSTRSVNLPPLPNKATYTAFSEVQGEKCAGNNLGPVQPGCKNLSRTGIRCIQRN